MSLATLKRKNNAKYNLSSNKIFSTKGVIRNIKGIGANIQINSDVRTIFKGLSPSGCGGLPGERRNKGVPITGFPLYIIGNCNYNNGSNNSVSTSTMTTKGLLSSRVYNPIIKSNDYLGGKEQSCREWWVKNFNPLDHAQSEYMRVLNVKKSANDSVKIEQVVASSSECYNYKIGTRKAAIKNTYNKNANTGAMSSGIYNKITLLRNNCLPPPPCKQPFPFIIEKRGCNTDYLTPEEAMLAGALPSDWMKCVSKYPTYYTYTINPYI